jgi:hypothetical protein
LDDIPSLFTVEELAETSLLLASCIHVGFLLGLFFYPEVGGDMSFRNVSLLLTDYTVFYTRR